MQNHPFEEEMLLPILWVRKLRLMTLPKVTQLEDHGLVILRQRILLAHLGFSGFLDQRHQHTSLGQEGDPPFSFLPGFQL